jgi:hypothetical protein
MMSSVTILPLVIVKVMTTARCPWGATRIAGAPSTIPVWACLAQCENASAFRATASAPRMRAGVPGGARDALARAVTSGSSRSSSAAKSSTREFGHVESLLPRLLGYLRGPLPASHQRETNRLTATQAQTVIAAAILRQLPVGHPFRQ